MKNSGSIDAYIQAHPQNVRVILEKLRQTIRAAAPAAQETISYGIPTFKLNGNLVHFGGFKNHIGFYPAPRGIEAFKAELAPYQSGKGTIQFPLDQPLPWELITKIVKFRVAENTRK